MKEARAREIIDGFRNHKVLLVGDVMLDHYVFGKIERLNPEAPCPLIRTSDEHLLTGGAGNSAKNVASLGAETHLVSVVGGDGYAGKLEEQSRKEGYAPIFIKDESRPTIRKMRCMVHNQQLFRLDFEETNDIPKGIEDEIIAAIREIGSKVDAIFVSDYAKGTITKRVADAILEVAKANDIPVAADIKVSRAPYFVGVTFISPNLKEGHEFLGLDFLKHRLEPREIAKRLNEQMKANVFLTLSGEGIYLYTHEGGDDVHVPQEHKLEVFDQSGAGDTATAVIILSLLSGATYKEATELANAGGAFVVSKVGSVALKPEELLTTVLNK